LQFWTSGANEGEVGDQIFNWCSSGACFRKTDVALNWTNTTVPLPNSTERFLAVKLTKAAVFEIGLVKASSQLSYICEVPKATKCNV